MDIQSIQYATADGDMVIVQTGADTLHVPWPCATWHRAAIQEWLDAGGVISPYDPPQAAPKMLSIAEFVARFSNEEQQAIMATMAPLALKVLTAPNGMVDVTDATALEARQKLAAATDDEGDRLFSDARLDEIFAAPE